MLRFSDAKSSAPVQEESANTHAAGLLTNGQPVFYEIPENSCALGFYRTTTNYLSETFEKIKQGQPFSIDQGYAIVREIMDSTVTRDEWYEEINRISYSMESDGFLVLHHANVAIYTICLSMTLRFTREEQTRVGIAALFHDIGKVCLPREILCKDGKLTLEEREVLRQYPFRSYEILNGLGREFGMSAECALMVNERMDGSGFPRGLSGNAIHCHAQMIGLVDVYEAMTNSRPYRKKWLHYDAIREILRKRKSEFHQSYIKALLRTFSIFRLNSYVKLNSGVVGRIIEVREDLPMRPKIEVLYDSENLRLPFPYVVDLLTQPVLNIAAPVAESELNAV